MMSLDTSLIIWLLGGIQLLGLMSALAARMSELTRWQTPCQCLFLACLVLIGGITVASIGVWPAWLACGVTLLLMTITVACEFGSARKATIW